MERKFSFLLVSLLLVAGTMWAVPAMPSVESDTIIAPDISGDGDDLDEVWTDVSDCIVNADFASIEGWTVAVDHVGESYGGTYYNLDVNTDPNTVEVYHTWSNSSVLLARTKNFKFSQKVMLSAGEYCLRLNGFYREGLEQNEATEKAWLFVGDNTQYLVGIGACGANSMSDAASVFRDGGCLNEFNFILAEDSEVEIGIQGYISTSLSWVIFGSMTLERKVSSEDEFMDTAMEFAEFGQSSMAMYSLSALQEEWAEVMALVEPLYSRVSMGEEVSNVELVDAIELMKTVMPRMKAVTAYYDGEFAEAKWGVYDILDNSTANSDEVRVAFDNVLAAALNVSAVTTVAELAAKVAEMEVARQRYVMNAVPAEGFSFDYTFLVVNPDMEGDISGWAGGWGYIGTTYTNGDAILSKFQEKWVSSTGKLGTTSAYQTIYNLPVGIYSMTATVNATCQKADDPKGATTGVYLFANDSAVAVATGDGMPEVFCVENVVVADGYLTLGIKCVETEANWVGFDNVRLSYTGALPDSIVVPDMPREPQDSVKASIEFDKDATTGWIQGAAWYDEANKIVGYTSPLYHFQGKVEVLRIVVMRNKVNERFFCLSELEFYDGSGQKIELSETNVTSNADHNALNPTAPDGGGIAALFDGNTGTYFHSAWKNIPDEVHYLEVTLPNGGYDVFSFRMLSRAKDSNDHNHTFPAKMLITNGDYHQVVLEDLLEMTSSIELSPVPEIGYCSGDLSYMSNVISEASSLVANNASDAECEAVVSEFWQAVEQYYSADMARMPEAGKVYHIISAFQGFHNNQLKEKAISINDTLNLLWWEDVCADDLRQGFMLEPILNAAGRPVFQNMTITRGNNVTYERHYYYTMKSAATGQYVDYDDAGRFHLVEQPCTLRLSLPDKNPKGQFHILTHRHGGGNFYNLQNLYAGSYNNGFVADSVIYDFYGGIPGVSAAVISGYGSYGSPATWFIREMHELPYTMPVSDAVFKSGFIHFDATDVITLTADAECSFAGLALRDEYGNWLHSIESEVSGNTITLTLERKITSCAFQFTNYEGVSSVTFNAGTQNEEISTDYVMKALDVKGRTSSVVNIPIEMDNVTAVNAFQFDLYLPEGVSVVSTMEDDEVLYDIAFNKNRSKSSHVLAVEPQDDGALRVAGYSTSNAAFVGNSGVLVNVAVSVGDIAEGDYSVVMRNIRMVTEDELGNAVEKLGADCTATLTVENTLLGDVNSDGNFTMIDVVMAVNAVLEKEQAGFNAAAADLNGDGAITMVDVVGVLRLVLTDGSAKAPVHRESRSVVAMPELSIGDLAAMGNGRVVLPVALSNDADYSAFQLDVTLPAGVELAEATFTGRGKASHAVAWNTLTDGSVRIVAYAMDNAAFRDNEGALLNLVLETTDEVSADAVLTLADGLFATAGGAEHRAADISVMMRSGATGVEKDYAASFRVYGVEDAVVVESSADREVSIYAATGKLVEQTVVKAGKNTIALPAGVYMVNGNKVIVK